MSDGVAVCRGIRVGAVRAPVGRNDAERVARDVLVEEDRFLRQLDDLARRADARSTGFVAVKHGVQLALVRSKVFYLVLKCGLVGRSFVPWKRTRHLIADVVARALIVV